MADGAAGTGLSEEGLATVDPAPSELPALDAATWPAWRRLRVPVSDTMLYLDNATGDMSPLQQHCCCFHLPHMWLLRLAAAVLSSLHIARRVRPFSFESKSFIALDPPSPELLPCSLHRRGAPEPTAGRAAAGSGRHPRRGDGPGTKTHIEIEL